MSDIGHFIDNQRVAGQSGRSQPVFNPATGQPSSSVALASAAEVDAAVASSKAAWPAWAKTPALRRARILDRFKMILWDRADQLAEAISLSLESQIEEAASQHEQEEVLFEEEVVEESV